MGMRVSENIIRTSGHNKKKRAKIRDFCRFLQLIKDQSSHSRQLQKFRLLTTTASVSHTQKKKKSKLMSKS